MEEQENKKAESKKLDSKSKVKSSTVDLLSLKQQLQKFRFDQALGQLTDVSKLRKKRKEIARFLTKQNMAKADKKK